MRHHLLVVSEKKIKMLKTAFAQVKSFKSTIGSATLYFCVQRIHVHNKYMYTIRA